jgi:hypothetical protein
MTDLKNSVTFLFFFLLLLFGVAQVKYVEENVINFNPIFFIIVTLAVLIGILVKPARRLSIYGYLTAWAVVYGLIWLFYGQTYFKVPVQVHLLQLVMVVISAGLSFDVGKQIGQVSDLLHGLSKKTYPHRTLELAAAEDRISSELTRSRRYQHPLSVLVIQMTSYATSKLAEHPGLQRDILAQFASAKVGQIINERVRETDLIMRDEHDRFIILCPETNLENSKTLARRIEQGVAAIMGVDISWGSAFFPSEALTFEDLILKAEERLEEADEIKPAGTAAAEYVEDPAEVSRNSVS